ncbi:uncharacterized protein LOC128222260 isoform X3 [Mya arenaria]|uniref:uncharacterized protein LOC128222260 isoform X3 n=1 Tax=Mya arenaria TaxID=6604 RepID=UPI0022E3F3F7|nr:uncharacterized protein LOC128222260 isoform X3 [Mya arenaria]
MRSVLLILTLCLTVVRPIEGSRLGRLEDDVKSLKSFLYRIRRHEARPALSDVLLTVLRPTEGSRLRRHEADVKLLKTFIFGELTYNRDEVKVISNRVDILENTTVTHDPSSPNQDKTVTFYNLGDKTGESGKTLVRAGNNEASPAVITVVQNMRKAYANDKKDLH